MSPEAVLYKEKTPSNIQKIDFKLNAIEYICLHVYISRGREYILVNKKKTNQIYLASYLVKIFSIWKVD